MNVKTIAVEQRPHRSARGLISRKPTLTAVVLSLFASVGVFATCAILYIISSEFSIFLNHVGAAEFFFGTRWEPFMEPRSFGILPLLAGTMWIVVISTIFAVPVGVMIGAYLHHFCGRKRGLWLKPSLEILAAIPTVVYGFVAVTLITPVMKRWLPETEIFNALSAGLVVGFMILPMISTLVHDALIEIPKRVREGAFALGAYPNEVFFGVEIRAIRARIFAAVVLSLSRAFGETMAVTLAAGAHPNLTWNPLESIQTITSYIVQASMGDAPHGTIINSSIYAASGVLFFVTLMLNLLAYTWIKRQKIGISQL
jgi:phosphate transport system permease protein